MTDQRFTPTEWEIIAGLPTQAITAAAVADGIAVVGTLRELAAGREAIEEIGARYPDNALVAAVLAEIREQVAEEEAALRMEEEGGPTPTDDPALDDLPDTVGLPEAEIDPAAADDRTLNAAPGDAVVAIEAPEVDPHDPDGYLHEVIANAMQAREILAAKASPEEASAYAAWILGAVQRVIERTRSGGFLGIGGDRVDADEARFRNELAAALGVSASG